MRRLVALLSAAACACGSADSASDSGATPPQAPRLVLVDALTGSSYQKGIVACIDAKRYPATPMPLSNVVGLAPGTGVDLGPIAVGSHELLLFDALVAKGRSDCDELKHEITSAPTLPFTVSGNMVNVVAVVGSDTPALQVSTTSASSALSPLRIEGRFQSFAAIAGTPTVTLGGTALEPRAFSVDYSPSATLSVKLGGAAASQTLQSVQYASDPTTDPETFFGQRKTFLFALVGDPAVKYDPAITADKTTGRELHLIAIPFGP